MPKVGLHILPFCTPHFVVWTPHFGWTPRLNYTVRRTLSCAEGSAFERSQTSGKNVFPPLSEFLQPVKSEPKLLLHRCCIFSFVLFFSSTIVIKHIIDSDVFFPTAQSVVHR